MSAQSYHVPVVLPDLRKEESVRQVVDALEYLDAVANDIFNRISFRVGENRDQLIAINNRINVAQAKIDKIRNSSSKATRVFSPPKYPAPQQVTDYCTVFHDVDPLLQKVRKNKAPIHSRVQEVNNNVFNSKKRGRERMRFRFTKAKTRQGVVMDDPDQLGEGLGSLPRHLPSVSSLLLFNTSENPYRKYVLMDPLSGVQIKTRDKVIENENELTEAPSSILHGEQLERATQDSTIYQPIMPDLPELEVPLSLPFLSHVADDVSYTADLGPSIAPSLANMPDLPTFTDTQTTAPSLDNAPPPPPPGPTEGGAPPPPPPPPPPPSVPILPPVNSDDEDEVTPPTAPPPSMDLPTSDDGRANLMEAIRKAGGASKAGLKNAKDRKKERKAKKEEQAVESPGDLLSDLSAVLGRRRKAMSGRDKKEEAPPNTGGGSMMDKVAAMIPPPPVRGGGGSDEESDNKEMSGDW